MNRQALTVVLGLAVALPACGGRRSAASGDTSAASFSVVIKDAGDQKINAIKTVREVTGLGLRDARDLVDRVPSVIKDHLSARDAEDLAAKLESAGMKVEVRPR